MNLRQKLMGVSITVLLLPLIISFTIVLISVFPMQFGETVNFDFLPPQIVNSVIDIIENNNKSVIEIDENIYAVYYENSGFIFEKEEIRKTVYLGKSKDDNSFSGLPAQFPNDTVGISKFTYNSKPGVVFFQLDAINPLNMIRSNILRIIIFLIVFAVLVPIFLSWRFLMSLRHILAQLELGTKKIASGSLDFDFTIPEDQTLTPVFTAFDDMKNELKDSYDSKKRFLMAISHDLKTPLTSIKGYIEVLEDGLAGTPEKQSEYLRILREKSELLEQRLLELIEFAKMETVDWKRKFCDFNGNQFFSDLLQLFSYEAKIKERTFENRTELKQSTILHGDQKMLFRVFENLFENAFRYTNRGGIIKVYLSVKNQNLVFIIEDNGPGISEYDKNLIFEPFYRADISRNTEGFGLGLNSARSIIIAHNGSITLENSTLGGAAFQVIIPIKSIGKK